jgi:hypothetical protein
VVRQDDGSIDTNKGHPTDNSYLTGCNVPNILAFQINIPINEVFRDPLLYAAIGNLPRDVRFKCDKS